MKTCTIIFKASNQVWHYFGDDYSYNILEAIGHGSSVGSASARYADGREFDPHVLQHSFVEFYHGVTTAILSLSLIQEGQLSVTGERICTKYW